MTRKFAMVSAKTLGFSLADEQNVVDLVFHGPRGGNAGSCCLSPKVARELGRELIEAADGLEPQDD